MNDVLPIIFAYVFWSFIVVCLWHMFWQFVYLPSKHWEYRIELFRLRDELRNLSIHPGKRLDPKIFRYMQSGMNSILKMMPFLDIKSLKRVLKAIREDDALKKRFEERIQILNECDIPEFQEIFKQTSQLHYRILFLNSVAKNPFILFTYFVVEIFKTFFSSLQNIRDRLVNRQLKSKPEELSVFPEREVPNLAQTAGFGNIA